MVWPTDLDLKLEEYDVSDLPGQQMPATQASTPLDHVLNLDIKAPPACQRLTAIMAAMGKSTSDVETIEKMILSGMNIALLNMSFGLRDDHVEMIKNIKCAAKNVSVHMGRYCPLAIAALLTGRKIRTGKIAESYGHTVELRVGEVVRLTSDETYKERCSSNTIFVDLLNLADQLLKGTSILLDNETLLLKVEVISSSTITCKVERGGILGSYKDVFIPNVVLQIPNYTEKDKADIEMLVKNQIDIVIAPFCHNAENIEDLKIILGEKGKKIAPIAYIQSIEGYKNFKDILEVSSGVFLSRQELGSDISPKKLVIAQKNMIAQANLANKPIIIGSQLLSSMTTRKLPLRAELLDISNCILDGADGLYLSGETAVGENPVDAVACLASACKEAEACVWSSRLFRDLVDHTPIPMDPATCSAMSGVLAAQRCIAAAILVVTTSGKSAQIISKYKPRCPIIAVTRYPTVARQLHLWRGIMPLLYENPPVPNWQADVENRVEFCTTWGKDNGFIRVGDPLIVISGWRQGSGFTNTMRVLYADNSMPAKTA